MPTPYAIALPFGPATTDVTVTQGFGDGTRIAADDHGATRSAADLLLFYAVDFAGPHGQSFAVLGQGEGKVVDSRMTLDPGALGPSDGFGNFITVAYNEPDGGTLYATYMHLAKTSVPTTIHQGVQFATSGDTGRITGPHLHVTYGVASSLYDINEPQPITIADGSEKMNSGPPVAFEIGTLFDTETIARGDNTVPVAGLTLTGTPGNDSLAGGSGDDFLSGGDGNDTESGGAGADIFHGSQDAGIDRVLDFSRAEGDRVQLDPGTTFAVHQVGADTVIDMGGGNQMILVGVQMTTLTPGWIFGA
jgi:hypothetical protein